MYSYVGNIHLHSRYSDGEGTVQEIAKAAEMAALDFIIITDHYNLKARADEGFYGHLLVLAGMEINDEENHYLALDISEIVNNGPAQDVINAVNRQQGIGIIAHPDEKGSPLYDQHRNYKWNDWSVQGFQGIEVWNFLSQFKDEVTGILKGLYLLFFPSAALQGPCKETVARLDDYQRQNHRVFAYGGSDAHGIKIKLGPVKVVTISPYDFCCQCINTHIISEKKMTGEKENDQQIIYEALRQGRFWIGMDYYKSSQGFKFIIQAAEKTWWMGDTVPWQKGLQAEIKTPQPARVKLVRDGRIIGESRGRAHRFPVNDRGVYRVEAYHRHLCGERWWIFSNPLWVI